MIKVAITYFLLIFSLSAESHDMRMAQFTVYIEDGQMICEGRIDREDFQSVLGDDLSNQMVEGYLRKHLNFKFNATNVDFTSVSYELKKKVISIRFALETTNYDPQNVEIFNTILLAEIEDQDNIMRFALHDKTRTFRFNEKRKTISFNY